MAEVVEINIISRVVLDNDILFSFIHEQVEIQGNRTIEAMNNWAYEGLHRLGSKEDIQNLLDTKIVCITQKAVDGYVGLNIEKVDKRFYYTIWFNNNKYENINNLFQLIKSFISFAMLQIGKQLIVCAIGKEVIFEFDEDMNKLIESIQERGVYLPTIVRQRVNGDYEMISGHRRKHAAIKAGLKTIPCIVKNLTDDEATILMVDSNIQREELLPSEKAFAYKMKLEAMKHQGKQLENTSRPMDEKSDNKISTEILGEEVGESARTIQRYIRLTYLIPDLLELVDAKRIALRPAVEMSYINEDNQNLLYDIFKYNESTPTLSQAQLLRNLEEKGTLTDNKIEEIMREEKPNQKEQFRTSYDKIRHYFPKAYSNKQIDNKIMELLEIYYQEWNKKKVK